MGEVRYTFVAAGQRSVTTAFQSIARSSQKAAVNVGLMDIQARRLAKTLPQSMRKAAHQMDAALTEAHAAEAERLALLNRATRDSASKQIRQIRRVSTARRKAARESVTVERRAAKQRAATRQREQIRQVRAERGARARTMGGAALGRVGRALTAGAAVMGTFAVASAGAAAIRQNVELGDLANKLSRAMHVKPGAAFEDPRALQKQFSRVAAANPGVAAKDVALAQLEFVHRTGKGGLAKKFAPAMAEFQLATGAGAGEVGGLTAALTQSFDVTGPEKLMKLLSTVNTVVKRGNFDPASLTNELPKFLEIFQIVGAPATAGAFQNLLGVTQLAAKLAGGGKAGAAVTATGMRSFFMQGLRKEDKIAAATGGFSLSRAVSEDFSSAIPKLIAAFGGDKFKIAKMFGRRSLTPIAPLLKEFNKLRAAGFSEREATEKLTDKIRLASDAAGSVAQMHEEAALASQSSSSQLTAAWEKVRDAFSEASGDAIKDFIKDLPHLVKELKPAILILAEMAKGLLAIVGAIGAAAENFVTAAKWLLDHIKPPVERNTQPVVEAAYQRDRAQKKAADLQEAADKQPPGPVKKRLEQQAGALRNFAAKNEEARQSAVIRLRELQGSIAPQEEGGGGVQGAAAYAGFTGAGGSGAEAGGGGVGGGGAGGGGVGGANAGQTEMPKVDLVTSEGILAVIDALSRAAKDIKDAGGKFKSTVESAKPAHALPDG